MADHGAEHPTYRVVCLGELLMICRCDVFAVQGEIQGCIGFAVLSITICEFADEMCFVTPLCPCLTEIHSDGSGGPSNLAGERIFLLIRKALAQHKDLQRKLICLLIDLKILSRVDLHRLLSDFRLLTSDF